MRPLTPEVVIRGSSSLICAVVATLFVARALVTRHVKDFARRLTVVLVTCNSASAWLDIIEIALEPHVDCKAVGFFRHFIVFSGIIWSLVVTINVYLLIVRNRDLHLHERRLHCAVWSFTLCVALLPAIGDTWGYAGFWCVRRRAAHLVSPACARAVCCLCACDECHCALLRAPAPPRARRAGAG